MTGDGGHAARDEYRTPVDVLLLVLREDRLLLTRRAGDIYGSGWWALPSGRLEPAEDVVTAAVRELDEELGLRVEQDGVTFVGVTHALPPDSGARIGFGFLVARWVGEPTIREPELCSALRWCAPDELPARTLPYTREIVRLHVQGEHFSRPGWPPSTPPHPVA
ncbi:NUDIX domain-containing protein [Frankia sp. AiPs1]|nr:NUDIX domain-containing protein [Frankia sp. AiPs1]MCM3922810.1 NUDIX domain-containing protein [Frankia sp. AiPs1]